MEPMEPMEQTDQMEVMEVMEPMELMAAAAAMGAHPTALHSKRRRLCRLRLRGWLSLHEKLSSSRTRNRFEGGQQKS